MTSHFLAQDLKHINSKLTYQCDMTQNRDFLIIHPFSLMVNQTSEFQVLGPGSTFKRSFVSVLTSSHPRTLLEPAESSSRLVTAPKLPRWFSPFSEGWAVTPRRWVIGLRRSEGSLWPVNDLRSFETSRNTPSATRRRIPEDQNHQQQRH
jgi:hypothetical protein